MAGNAEIHQAFREALKAAVFLLPIAWASAPFTPKNVAFLEEALLPSETATPTLGDGLVRAEGIYQITCVYPNGKGQGDAQKMSDRIIQQFKRGTNLTAGGLAIIITNAWASPALSDPAWIRIPNSIRYFTYYTP